jgi:hypothetical protein
VERRLSELAPDPATFSAHFALVEAYVKSRPGSHAALMSAAREDPEGVTRSVVTLGAVLLDIAAGAYRLTPEQMLEKLGENVDHLIAEEPEQPAT